jgi:predicted AlkP superfamily pyrophosphatase or phosphodiesterase
VTGEAPRLIVQITVDGLPTETVMRHSAMLHPKGLGRFLSEGTVYLDAEYPYLTTYTAVGHASLFTGALPCTHGIIGNEWLNSETGNLVYCVEDRACTLLDFPTKEHEGTSPANMNSTTVGDELIRASQGKSRVFSVSGKDRGAILPAGKHGKAFWYSKTGGCFLTSSHYYAETPEWLKDWRSGHSIAQYQKTVWQPLRKPEDYFRVGADDRPSEKGMGPAFPHDMGTIGEGKLADAFRWTPFIDEMTMALAHEILVREKLGQDGSTDMLCVSLSALDFVSHQYGPDSLEAEDTLYRVDALLSDFLELLGATLGLDNVLVVLSADHGFGLSPEQAQVEGLPSHRVTSTALETLLEEMRAELKSRHGLDPKAVRGFQSPFLYLDRAVIAQCGAQLDAVQRTAAEIAARWPGVDWAVTRGDLMAGLVPRSKLHDRAFASLNPTRGGDVLVVLKPWSLIETVESAYPSTHGSPYAYDTRVPVFFLGKGIKARQATRPVSPLDIAATLSIVLNITPPPACVGFPMREVLGEM